MSTKRVDAAHTVALSRMPARFDGSDTRHSGASVIQTLVRIQSVLASLGVICIVTACVPLPGGYVLSQKPVAAKEGAATLVADDGTRCRVPPGAFAEVKPGDEHSCAWHEGAAAGRAPERAQDPTVPRRTPPARPPGG